MGCSPHTTFRECTHPVVTGTTKGHANQVCHRRVIIDYQDIPGQFPRLTEVSAGIKRFNISFQLDSFVRAKDPTGSFKGREEYVPHSRSGYYLDRAALLLKYFPPTISIISNHPKHAKDGILRS